MHFRSNGVTTENRRIFSYLFPYLDNIFSPKWYLFPEWGIIGFLYSTHWGWLSNVAALDWSLELAPSWN